MSRTPATFKAADVIRAVNAVRAAGLEVTRTEIFKDGRIVLNHIRNVEAAQPELTIQIGATNEWDDYIDAQV